MRIHLTLFLVIIPIIIFGQSSGDTVDLSSPYHTIHTHLWFLQPLKDQYDPSKAAEAFSDDVDKREQRAIQLKQILDGKGLRVKMSQLPRSTDFRDTLAKENIYVLFPEKLPEVYLEKIGEEWLYSEETVEVIPKLHKQVYPFGTDVLIGWLPAADHYQFLGLRIWQYIGIFILLFVTWLLHLLTSLIFRNILRKALTTRFKDAILDEKLLLQIARLCSYIFIVWVWIKMLPIIQLEVKIASIVLVGLKVLRTFFGILLSFKIVEIVDLATKKITAQTENTMDEQIRPIIKQTLNIIIGIVGGMIVLNMLNVNVTALIAGLSIGGLALALAAQETVKNLIGSMMIFVDRPFKIGDFIAAGGVMGTVEEVGFRSTRIRTPENSVTTMPNGNLANIVVNNLGLRIYRRFNAVLNLTYKTTPDQIEAFVAGIKDIILEHPKTRKEAYQVYFSAIGTSSLDVVLVVFYEVTTLKEEQETTQEILIAVMKLAKEIGVEFAFPTTSVYLEKS